MGEEAGRRAEGGEEGEASRPRPGLVSQHRREGVRRRPEQQGGPASPLRSAAWGAAGARPRWQLRRLQPPPALSLQWRRLGSTLSFAVPRR